MRKFLKFIYAVCLVGVVTIGGLLLLTAIPVPGFEMDARVVQSGSMEPAIPAGSVIFIIPSNEYGIGDVVTFRRGDIRTPTTHRIVDIDEETGSFITQGDANRTKDRNPITEDAILGSVRFHIPFLGYVINFARQPFGLLLLVIIPTAVIAGDEVRKIAKTINDRNRSEIN